MSPLQHAQQVRRVGWALILMLPDAPPLQQLLHTPGYSRRPRRQPPQLPVAFPLPVKRLRAFEVDLQLLPPLLPAAIALRLMPSSAALGLPVSPRRSMQP